MKEVENILCLKPFHFTIGHHKNIQVIWIQFPNDFELSTELRKFTKIYWSRTQKCWYAKDHPKNRSLFNLPKKWAGKEVLQKISKVNLKEFQLMHEELILKGFSENTIRTYTAEFAQLLYAMKDKPVNEMSDAKIRSYMLYCHKELNLSEAQIHSRMNALKFYFEKVLKREKMFFDIPRPKKPKLLPKALNQDEIKRIINITENLKHQVIIKLCYGMGLRVSEIVNIKLEDIDSKKMLVFIHRAKGKKDRYVKLPHAILNDLRSYYKEFKPQNYLFEGQDGEKYSTRSAQNVFKNAMNKAGIRKKVGIHSLRHSYATHLLEYGTDIRVIKELMGHNSIKTTEIYTNISDIQTNKMPSPLDYL